MDQLEVLLSRIAEALELHLKLSLIQANMSLEDLRTAEYETPPPTTEPAAGAEAEKPAVELLQQTHDEIAQLNETYDTLVERMGKGNVPLDLDLYAEAAKLEPDNPEEAI